MGASEHLLEIRVPDDAAQAIRRHGEETYPHECCGALLGCAGTVTATVPLPNTTEEGPRPSLLKATCGMRRL